MKLYPLIVIGAGPAGLVIANGAAKAGKKVLLIDKGTFGGDCTNFGCIPSKSLIASAHVAHAIREGKNFGIFNSPTFKADESLARVRRIIEEVRSHEDPPALTQNGVETLTAMASFENSHTLRVGEETIMGKKIVLATGTSPAVPTIKGLDKTPYLTNETIFDLQQIPATLAVIGGGPIGCELAQAFQRLGSQVTVIHAHDRLLNKEDPLAQTVIEEQFKKEGIQLHLGVSIQEAAYHKKFQITLKNGQTIEADNLLVAVGRVPNVASLKLEAAGVYYSEEGISVDQYGRTSQKHIWAIGDVAGKPFFTHAAEHQARAVLISVIVPWMKKLDRNQPIPRVTFTDPEVASVGLSEEAAAKEHSIATYFVPLAKVDRAITAGRTEGFIKVITKKWSSRILGCTIVAPHAGEMISQVTTAMMARIPLRKLAQLIHPFPTYSQAIRNAADLWLTQTILPLFRRKK